MQFRNLERHEIERIWTIDRRELIERIYVLDGRELRLQPHDFDVPGWPPDQVRDTTPLLYESFDRGGVFYGAFDREQLVGVAVLDTIWRGSRGDLLQLEFLHVSRDYRARGLGSDLFAQACAGALERGARGLYISATPSENTVRFYQRQGSVVLDSPDPELFAREPEDIHFECVVQLRRASRFPVGEGDESLRKEWLLSDDVITIRPPRVGDSVTLVAGRDEEWERWLGPGSDDPRPTACILLDDTIIGWVDYDPNQDWLRPGEVNIGYSVFARYRGRGYATRAVMLLLQRLATQGQHSVGILSIARENYASLRVAEKTGFELVEELPVELRFARVLRRDRRP